LLLRIS
jgi:hypothetical protein